MRPAIVVPWRLLSTRASAAAQVSIGINLPDPERDRDHWWVQSSGLW
ncbi:MAG: hypothetical protein JWN85_2255 [Gammaproteobacteria bacterium]|nr:hypothetical protein [Gammaproteobacteria bacterium]